MAPISVRVVVVFTLAAIGSAMLAVVPAQPANDPGLTADTPIDVLIGRNGRAVFAAALRQYQIGGRTYPWEQYVEWGRELLLNGQVKNPPQGPAPSERLSRHYTCVHCHNLAREDVRLTVQDPEARERLIRQMKQPNPERRDGKVVALTPGATLWGAVNREEFYNGAYKRYRVLKVADSRVMDPSRLADAVQVCCNYCSAGRYALEWELSSMLAALWELELRLKDLDLSPPTQRELLDRLGSRDQTVVRDAQLYLRRQYLRASGVSQIDAPIASEGDTDIYGDGARIAGNARAGQLLYQSACAGCHDSGIGPVRGAALVENDRRLHRYVRQGTEREGLYMPYFPSQRLSRPQLADIRAYLRSLPRD